MPQGLDLDPERAVAGPDLRQAISAGVGTGLWGDGFGHGWKFKIIKFRSICPLGILGGGSCRRSWRVSIRLTSPQKANYFKKESPEVGELIKSRR